MTNRFWRGLALLLVIPALMLAASCAKKEVKSEPAVTPAAKEEAKAMTAEERARAQEERRLREERLREQAMERKELAERESFLNDDIYFEFDKSSLLPEAKKILRRKAEWLRGHRDVSVVIEGHCDERGTNEYNMALGDRRTRSAKRFLVDMGIASGRLTTISYGEERPVDPRHNEEAWSKNRRGHFVID